MRVLEIYDRKDLYDLKYNDIPVGNLMDDFFKRFPCEYRKNYDKNIKKLEVLNVDELHEKGSGGEFFPNYMQIFYKKNVSYLIHEIMHMASYDDEKQKFAISRNLDFSIYEGAFVEGMTEYLACLARGSAPNGYFYHVFVISMLSCIDGLFGPYFIPSYDNFIKLFPNKKDIISLMYVLEFYHDKYKNEDYDKWEIVNMKKTIMSIIDGLIDIELSFDKTEYERKLYGEKFMSLISDMDVNNEISAFYKDYKIYAYDNIKKRILRR